MCKFRTRGGGTASYYKRAVFDLGPEGIIIAGRNIVKQKMMK
jgi:hypothetical protein